MGGALQQTRDSLRCASRRPGCHAPTEQDMRIDKRFLSYLAGIAVIKLMMGSAAGGTIREVKLIGYTDADYVEDKKTRKPINELST